MAKRKFHHPVVLVLFLMLALTSSSLAFLPSAQMAAGGSAVADAAGAVRINEVMFYPTTGAPEWVELKNTGTAPAAIGGYGITDEDNNWYLLPAALPPVPGGALVLVIFDGAGQTGNDYDFADNLAVLHSGSGVVNIFEDAGDQCGLYAVEAGYGHVYLPAVSNTFASGNPSVPGPPADYPASSVVDFVAWGVPPEGSATLAAEAGIWDEGWFKSVTPGLGAITSGVPTPGETLGLLPGSQSRTLDDWTLYLAAQATRGGENAWPIISWFYPAAGATIDGATFTISWNAVEQATGYRFQLDNNADFSSPLVDSTLSEAAYMAPAPMAEGTYYWRVNVIFATGASPWSPGVAVRSLTLPAIGGVTLSAEPAATLGIPWQLQHKDTNMLCLDGDAESGSQAWDGPHASRGTHGNMYCARASIAMMASYYGGHLSQDRITYEIFKGGAAEGDLGHDIGVSLAQIDSTVSWALGTTITRQDGKPAFSQIKSWIDAQRPIGSVIPGHMRVIDGYWEFSIGPFSWQFIHLLDPWDQAKWVSYADDNIIHVWVGPAGPSGAPNVRSDEDFDGDSILDTVDDSDGDGVSDFDERNRFGLEPWNPDSDSDEVPDKLDIRGYVFDNSGAYSRVNPDIDGDGRRKELDVDNDYKSDAGTMDGCEDGNRDGKYQPASGETNNFKPSDDKSLHIQLTWPKLGADVDLHLVKPGSSMWSEGDVYFSNRDPDWGTAGVCGNPNLDVDCITQCTVENIRLDTLESGTYTVKVHYYSDHSLGTTAPTITAWVQGVRYSFGPVTVTNGQVWDVFTLEWPSKVVRRGSAAPAALLTEDLDPPMK